MTKLKSRAALIIRLCRTLAETRISMDKEDLRVDARHICRTLEPLILDRLDEHLVTRPGVQSALVATGSARLVDAALEDTDYLKLDPQEWKRLLLTTPPDGLKSLFGRGLARYGATVPMLGRIASGHREWVPLLEDIGAASNFREHTILTKNYRGLLTNPGTTAVIASYLRAQVISHTGAYTDLAKNYLSKSDLYLVAILNLAGVGFDRIERGLYRPGPVAERFLSSMASAHGKMAYLERCRSLEHLLANAEPFEAWRQEIARNANVVLRPL